jgi:hypothetical protein
MSARARGLLLALVVLGPVPVAAQGIRRELGVQAIALAGSRSEWGGGVFGGLRPSTRARVSLFLGGGAVDQRAFARGELLAHFLLAPALRRGMAPYVAGGLALDVADRTDARIVALAGIEGAPGARRGWIVEAGVGGGWRFAAGWRWRR